MKKILFLDRDGVLIKEPPATYQVDNLEQMELLPGLLRNLYQIATQTDYLLVMVTNQDGLGTAAYPQENFDRVQGKLLQILENEGIVFHAIHVDKSYEHENLPTRKPGIGMLEEYLNGDYDLANSYVVGDRWSDIKLAENLGTKAIGIRGLFPFNEWAAKAEIVVDTWDEIAEFLLHQHRHASVNRKTKETDITVRLNLDGTGQAEIATGIGFFDHMLEQIARHGQLDLTVNAKGDLHIDEHHTIEDSALTLGEAFLKALGDKRGIERYGFCLPMDDCLAQVALDFGGRPWLVWEADFQREKVGDMPTEMFLHFFKSFSDTAKCNLNIKAEGQNEHHKIEAIFKAFAKAIKMAARREGNLLPSTKGVL
ncbi:MAG: bifunctional histidinol-phosphatase/imidazoleglycerol-phosphate dehydratase HisB [Lewinellaceae bacterium]|nr:bifunctional histidinol-phosphatase/imidazoleglycerol-phosphate dehydratase HisB [Saprospiraceae bacterium]MCB9339320.1 bifunctional histidinol-phosphatase/imidazoleglycerol-phosphate dehydratase HisB [Lewinellaceae bacterium]